jgi:two-component system response regulator AdeR
VYTHTVLIIEDTVELAEVIQATLENMNIKTYHATHGEKGLKLYKQIKPDLILLDIALPDIKGWKVLERLKDMAEADPTLAMPTVVIISAYGDPANRLMGKLQDISRYLIKPFTPDEVERLIGAALGLEGAEPLPPLTADDTQELNEVLRLMEAEVEAQMRREAGGQP